MTPLAGRPVLVAAAVALVGLAAGAVARQGLVGMPGRPWAATTTATVFEVRRTATGAEAVVDLLLVTSEPAEVTAAMGSGAGIAPGQARRPLTPTAVPSTPLTPLTQPDLHARHLWYTVPLHCSPEDTDPAVPTRFTLSVTTGKGERHETTGPPAFLWVGQRDVCSFAQGVLPIGWEHPATVVAFTPDHTTPVAHLTISGLHPGDQVSESSPEAPLSVDQPGGTVDAQGRTTVTIRMVGVCQDTSNRELPVGITLSGSSPERGTTTYYVHVGLPLARWAVDVRLAHCPEDAPTPAPLY